MSTEPLLVVEVYFKEKEDSVIMIKGAEEEDDKDVEIESKQVGGGQPPSLVIRWGQRRFVDPFLVILRRGLRPKQLAISASLGITLGIFPVYEEEIEEVVEVAANEDGQERNSSSFRDAAKKAKPLQILGTTFQGEQDGQTFKNTKGEGGVTVVLSAIVGALLRSNCNLPTLMLANLVATPLQLGLIVPFLRLGEWVSGGQHLLLTPNALWMAITGKASDTVLFGLLHSLIGWAIMTPPIFGGLYVIFYPLFWCLIQKFGANSLVHTPTYVSPQSTQHEVSSLLKDPEI